MGMTLVSAVLITYYTYRKKSLLLILHNTTTNAAIQHIFTILSLQFTKCCVCRVRNMRESFDTQLCCWSFISDNTSAITSRWRNNGRDGVSNHQPRHWLLNCLYRSISKKTSKLRATGPCAGNSPVAGEFPAALKASNAKRFPFNDVIMISKNIPLAIFKTYT